MADSVLVTGASGFLAKHCILALLQAGFAVRGTVRNAQAGAAVRAALAPHAPAEGRLDFAVADLTADDGWAAAAAGCRYVLHTASPFPIVQPRDRMALIGPAREGSLRVLRAAAAAGVERCVLTSSTAAVFYGHGRGAARAFTEADWTDPEAPGVTAYAASKTLAERAAWDFARSGARGMGLAVINPSFILGPVLDTDVSSSGEVVRMMLQGKYPAVPRLNFPTVDVRDVAAAHVAAMTLPGAAGQRYIASADSLWLVDLARILAEAFPAFRRKIPRRELPDLLTRALALVDANIRSIRAELGLKREVSNARARTELGVSFRPAGEAAIATARSLIDQGAV